MSFAEFHFMGGILFMSVLSLSFFIILATAVLNILRISKNNYDASRQFLSIPDIKSIGIFAIVWGVFGQSIGLFSAFQAIEAAGDIAPGMLYGGLKVSMITTLYGTFIFLVSWILWIILSNWQKSKSA